MLQGVHGAGVLQNQCEGNITSCTFSDNYATDQGGSCSALHLPLNSFSKSKPWQQSRDKIQSRSAVVVNTLPWPMKPMGLQF